MKATEVTAGPAESNGSLLPGLWRDSLHVTCGLTACTPGSAPGPTLGNEYGKTLPLPIQRQNSKSVVALVELEIYEQLRLYFETWRYPENRKYRGTHCTLYSDATSKH